MPKKAINRQERKERQEEFMWNRCLPWRSWRLGGWNCQEFLGRMANTAGVSNP
jgi:hypothetical protein